MLKAAETMLKAMQDNLTGYKVIRQHSGKLTPKGLAAVATKTPALLLAVLGFRGLRKSPGGMEANLRMVAYHVMTDGRDDQSKRVDKDGAILTTATATIGLITDPELWPFEEVESVAGEEIGSDDSGKGVALWGVAWSQWAPLNSTGELAQLNEFLTAGVTWDFAEPDGTPEAQDEFNVRPEDGD